MNLAGYALTKIFLFHQLEVIQAFHFFFHLFIKIRAPFLDHIFQLPNMICCLHVIIPSTACPSVIYMAFNMELLDLNSPNKGVFPHFCKYHWDSPVLVYPLVGWTKCSSCCCPFMLWWSGLLGDSSNTFSSWACTPAKESCRPCYQARKTHHHPPGIAIKIEI